MTMTRRQRNPCVYTGKVGAKMRPPKPRRKPVQRVRCKLQGGPLDGCWARLELGALHTLPLALRGQCGRYAQRIPGNVLEWQPA